MALVGYQQIVDKFWPRGVAWPRDPDTLQGKLRKSLAPEYERVEVRVSDLLNEVDPRTTVELLADWERVLGLPDNCGAPPITLEQRRNAVVTKLTAIGGQSPQYFIDLAAAFGFDIAIQEYDLFTCESEVDDLLCGEPWAHTFKVIAGALKVWDMNADSFCTEYLRNWGNDILECLINKYKPAHTIAIFEYTGEALVTEEGESLVTEGGEALVME